MVCKSTLVPKLSVAQGMILLVEHVVQVKLLMYVEHASLRLYFNLLI